MDAFIQSKMEELRKLNSGEIDGNGFEHLD
jgi:hypothetical protein